MEGGELSTGKDHSRNIECHEKSKPSNCRNKWAKRILPSPKRPQLSIYTIVPNKTICHIWRKKKNLSWHKQPQKLYPTDWSQRKYRQQWFRLKRGVSIPKREGAWGGGSYNYWNIQYHLRNSNNNKINNTVSDKEYGKHTSLNNNFKYYWPQLSNQKI